MVDICRSRPGIWAVKPLAVVGSRFQKVLLLDADNLPIHDPSTLFDTVEFRLSGALFWPDFRRYPDRGHYAWQALSAGRWTSRPGFCQWEQESGQVVVDKARCSTALKRLAEFAVHLQSLAPYLPGDGGDKDLFQFAWGLSDA